MFAPQIAEIAASFSHLLRYCGIMEREPGVTVWEQEVLDTVAIAITLPA